MPFIVVHRATGACVLTGVVAYPQCHLPSGTTSLIGGRSHMLAVCRIGSRHEVNCSAFFGHEECGELPVDVSCFLLLREVYFGMVKIGWDRA